LEKLVFNQEEQLDLTLCADAQEVSSTVAAEIIEAIDEGLEKNKRFDLALTGGTLGSEISKNLLKVFNLRQNDFAGLHLWWSDERFVSVDSQDRNCLNIYKNSLNSNLTAHFVNSVEDGSASSALQSYVSQLKDINFDLIILGLGPDGHIASIFPNSSHLNDSGVAFLIEDSPKLPSIRISFTLETINKAREVWIVAAGEEKAEAVTKLINGNLSIPASLISAASRTRLIADTEAFFAE
jgi:6-phosphogluconolactonase